jgi:hypothetical protein
MSAPDAPGEWEPGWEGHGLAQARRRAALSLVEKLDWLEQAQQIVEALGRARKPSAGSGGEGKAG